VAQRVAASLLIGQNGTDSSSSHDSAAADSRWLSLGAESADDNVNILVDLKPHRDEEEDLREEPEGPLGL
jgi:hypothetical protein